MKRLALLDYGRFFAAVAVMLFHYTFNGIINGKIQGVELSVHLFEVTKYGYLGIQFFFMISGYVIFMSAKNSTPQQFLVSRALRLYPAYWFGVIFTSCAAVYWGGDLMTVNLHQTLINLSLFQKYFGIDNVDGVYWTLVYEVQFYLMVFVLIFVGLKSKLNLFFVLWPVAMLIAYLLGYDYLPFLSGQFYFFSAGALFALLKEQPSHLIRSSLLLVLGLCLLFTSQTVILKSEHTGVQFSSTVVVIIILVFFVFFLVQNTPKIQMLKLPKSKLLGAMTYPLYLIHAYFGYMLISQFESEPNKTAVYIFVILLVLFLAYAINRLVEVALATFWKSLFMAILYRPVAKIHGCLCALQLKYHK